MNQDKIILPEALNSIQSQRFGRRVYQLKHGDQFFWLKLQIKNINADYEQGFFNEINCYAQLNALETPMQDVLCNFSILDPYQKFQIQEDVIGQAIWVENTDLLFEPKCSHLAQEDVYNKLMLSLSVLENLHDCGFIHGDLKHKHLRYKQQNSYLIDFEQAFSIHQDLHVLKPLITATPRYMAPELFHAQAKSLQSDIYALGIIWLEWLTEQRLFARNYQDWAILHCQQLNVCLPDRFKSLEMILSAMLNKKIEQRCSNIYQIKQALSKIV
jgi:serine/threonine protein kinase